MRNIENTDFVYVLVNMIYEPWFWMLLFSGIVVGWLAASYMDKL